MRYLALLGVLVAVFLALLWLAVAFNRYCDAVNRVLNRRRARHSSTRP